MFIKSHKLFCLGLTGISLLNADLIAETDYEENIEIPTAYEALNRHHGGMGIHFRKPARHHGGMGIHFRKPMRHHGGMGFHYEGNLYNPKFFPPQMILLPDPRRIYPVPMLEMGEEQELENNLENE